MDSKRSTRRSVNPPDSEHQADQDAGSSSLSDVESILNEIESLVTGGTNEGTAKPTSVVESQEPSEQTGDQGEVTLESDLDEQDIKQLSVDLDAAIAAELNQLDSISGSDSAHPEEGCEPEDAESEPTSIENPNQNEGEPVIDTPDDGSPESMTGSMGIARQILKVMSGPMPSMSQGSRTVVSIFAVSLAIWVPVIWMLALTTQPKETDRTNGEVTGSMMVEGVEEARPEQNEL